MSKSKPYTNRSNCVRAAKAALGKTAKPGEAFTLDQDGTMWTWTPTTRSGLPQPESNKEPDAPKAAKAKRKRAKNGEKSSLLHQPQMAAVLGMMQRKTGASVEEIVERLKCNRDTGRGMVSRCKTAGAPIETKREGRFVRYSVDADWVAK